VSAPLDSRVVRIVRWLVAQTEPRSTAELATGLGLSERAVRYRLSAVQNFLNSHGAELQRQLAPGLLVIGNDVARESILDDLDSRTTAPRVYAPDERQNLLLDALLWNHPETISLDRLNEQLEVSKTSARRDLKNSEPWLERMGLPVARKPGEGIALIGSEQRARRALVQLLLEALPADVLTEIVQGPVAEAELLRVRVSAGLRDRILQLPIEQCANAVRDSVFQNRLAQGNSEVVYTLYLAVTVARIGLGRSIDLEPGQFRSLRDHPVVGEVDKLANSVGLDLGVEIDEEEIAGLTEYLLGCDALLSDMTASKDVEHLVSDILDRATDRLHASLVDDEELRRSLGMHLTRLSVRLRYGLPVHNPLKDEVAERYPEVQSVAEELSEMLGTHFGEPLGGDEIGFIAMYLSGALERGHLRPRRRAMVVCPAGMATAWVLVSRLQAEFPEVELAEVLSASVFEERDTAEFDLVISTVALENAADTPVVVVSPLLSSSDVVVIRSTL